MADLSTDHFVELFIILCGNIVMFIFPLFFVVWEGPFSLFIIVHHGNDRPPTLIKVRLVLNCLMTIQSALDELNELFSHQLSVRSFTRMVAKVVEKRY